MSFQNVHVPTFHNDNSLDFGYDEYADGLFEEEDPADEILEREDSSNENPSASTEPSAAMKLQEIEKAKAIKKRDDDHIRIGSAVSIESSNKRINANEQVTPKYEKISELVHAVTPAMLQDHGFQNK
jgi:hypothetical protein